MSYFAHSTAIIDDNVNIGDGTKIWHFAHICSGARIGTNCIFGQNTMVANDVVIGSNVKVQNNVAVYTGTVIEDDSPNRNGTLKAVTAIKGVSMITVEGKGMIGVPGIAARTFGAVARLEVSVLLITQASSEQSICFIVPEPAAGDVVAELEAEFAPELGRKDIESIWSRDNIAIVTIVGAGIQTTFGVAGKLFSALGDHCVNVLAIAQGSTECGISVVIEEGDVGRAIVHLHNLIVFPGAQATGSAI